MKRRLLIMVATAMLAVSAFVVPMSAATTQDITVTATPTFISIVVDNLTMDFGAVAASSTPNSTTDYFTITNSSTVITDITLTALTGWDGGANDWSWGAAGEDTGKLAASAGTGTYSVDIAAVDTPYEIIDSLAATTNDSFELQLVAPSSFTYGNEQTVVVRVTSAAHV